MQIYVQNYENFWKYDSPEQCFKKNIFNKNSQSYSLPECQAGRQEADW